MKKHLLYSLLALLFIACNNNISPTASIDLKEQVTTYYLIRHAEKDRSDSTNQNPGLTEEGHKRARNWAKYFENIPIDQIYATAYSRTQQTASYTASNKKIAVETYDANDLYNKDFKILTAGQSVLIVGHSNTTPQFVNAIISENKYVDIPDNENGMLYIVTIKGDVIDVDIKTIN